MTGYAPSTKQAVDTFLSEHGYRIAPVTIDNSEWIFARAYDLAEDRGDEETRGRIANAYLPYMEAYFEYYESQSRALFGREIAQVLLLHANALNAATFGRLAQQIADRGYTFVSLETALEDEAYESPDAYVGTGGISWLHRWAITQGRSGDFFRGEPEVPRFVMEYSGVERR